MPFAKQSGNQNGIWHEERGSKGEPKVPVPMPRPVKIPYPSNKGQ